MSTLSRPFADQAAASPGQLVEQLLQFDGSPKDFLTALLSVQCHVGGATHGAILRLADPNIEVLAVHPPVEPDSAAPVWLAQSVELSAGVIRSQQSQTHPLHTADELYGTQAQHQLTLVPIWGRQTVRGVAVFVVPNRGPDSIEQSRRRLELTVPLLSLYELRLTLMRRNADLHHLKQSCEVLAAVNEHDRYKAAAMALCNHLASSFKAERVSLGFARGRAVHVHAMSHTEKFTRKTELVQAVESAMEECFDQDIEVLFPAPEDAPVIARAAGELSRRHGPSCIVSLPLRHVNQTVGALTLEFPPDEPPSLESIEMLRLTSDLCTARLVELEAHDCWIGSRLARRTRSALAALLSPRHTWAKASALVLAALIVFSIFADGAYRVSAPFVIQAVERRVVSAPFDGYLIEALVKRSDRVRAGDSLAKFDVSELRLQMTQALAERAGKLTEASIQLRENKIAEARIAEAEAARLAAQAALLQWRIDRADIRSPLEGVIINGDYTHTLNKMLKQGDVLYEIAPLDALRAELAVTEDRIADLNVGQIGELAAVAQPGRHVRFTVERIDPVAQIVEGRNVFLVRVRLDESPDWLRPGMEGAAKIDIDRRSYARIWTGDMVNWIRMKLWL